MDLTTEMSYPGADVEQVLAMVLDPAFREAVCDATMAIARTVEVQYPADGSVTMTVDRTLPAQVPDFVRTFVGDTIELVQVETWAPDDGSGSRQARLTLTVVGQPATMTATIVVEPTPDGAREVVRGQLKVAVPFFGGKIESEIAKGIVAAARKEQETGRAWLSA